MVGLVSSGMSGGLTPEGQAAKDKAARDAAQAATDAAQQRINDNELQQAQLQRMHQDASAAPGTVRWDGGDPNGVAGGGGGSSRSSSSGGAGTGHNPALDGLIAEIHNQQPGTVTAQPYTPTPVPTGISPAANAATYGAAKERIGLSMQAAMKGLRSNLAQRGIVGTGIDAEEQGKVYSSGLGQLGGVDRQIATDDAQRQLTADTANANASNQAGQFNSSENLAAQQANLTAQNQRQNILLQLASLY